MPMDYVLVLAKSKTIYMRQMHADHLIEALEMQLNKVSLLTYNMHQEVKD